MQPRAAGARFWSHASEHGITRIGKKPAELCSAAVSGSDTHSQRRSTLSVSGEMRVPMTRRVGSKKSGDSTIDLLIRSPASPANLGCASMRQRFSHTGVHAQARFARECCSAYAFHSHPATPMCMCTLPCLAPPCPSLGSRPSSWSPLEMVDTLLRFYPRSTAIERT
jgi:hypothetical protein